MRSRGERKAVDSGVDMTPASIEYRLRNHVLVSSRLAVGIDPGVNTGVAIWDYVHKRYVDIRTMPIHEAWKLLNAIKPFVEIVIVEDVRKLKRRGGLDPARIQGAGSVKRDCSAWEKFLSGSGYGYVMRPIGKYSVRKCSTDYFKATTEWPHITSSHGRDAAMLVFQWRAGPLQVAIMKKPAP